MVISYMSEKGGNIKNIHIKNIKILNTEIIRKIENNSFCFESIDGSLQYI